MKFLLCVICASAVAWTPLAKAQGKPSTVSTLSALAVGSVIVTASTAAVVSAALWFTGKELVVNAIEITGHRTIWVLQRPSDGAQVSIQVSSVSAKAAAVAVGTSLGVSAVAAGVILSAAGEAVAFIPNALGQALLHDERLTR